MIDVMPRLVEVVEQIDPNIVLSTVSYGFSKIGGGMGGIMRSGSSEESETDISITSKRNERGFMDTYLEQLNTVKTAISAVTKVNDQFKEQAQLVKTNVTQEDEAKIRETINSLTNTQSETLKMIHAVIQGLTKENELLGQQYLNNAELRIRENLLAAVTRKFRQVVNEYQSMQDVYRQENKKRIMRQLDIIHAANVVGDEDLTQQAMTHGIGSVIDTLLRGGGTMLHAGVADIEEKYEDVKILEKNLIELHQMFEQLATMVDMNGEILDNIECHVDNADDLVEKGVNLLEKAKKQKKRSKKIATWISLIVGVILGIICLCVFV